MNLETKVEKKRKKWDMFVRLAVPNKHLKAITRRPLLLRAVGKQNSYAGQKIISISSMHGKVGKVKTLLERLVASSLRV